MIKPNFKRLRPLSNLSLTQILVLLAVVAALIIFLDLNRREQAGRMVGINEDTLAIQVTQEWEHRAELQATLSYVQSDGYVADYARGEAGLLLPGERRVVPITIPATPVPQTSPVGTPDPAENARPWQAWLRLLTDSPQPTR